jgi:hypothetical protein
MAITINLNTIGAQVSYFGGATGEWYFEAPDPLTGVPTFTRRRSVAINQPNLVATLIFNNVPAGRSRFCVRGSDDKLRWRSPVLDIETGNETFAFHIVAIAPEETLFDSSQFEDEIDLPITQNLDDLDEDLVITSLDLTMKDDHIDIDGEGKLAKGADWTILSSELDYDYDFNIKPIDSINHKRFVKIDPVANLTLNLSNPITGFGAWLMQDKLNETIREILRKKIDKQIRKQLEDRVGSQFGDDPAIELVTATVVDSKIIEDGTETVTSPTGGTVTVPIHKLQLLLDISIPSSLLQSSTGGGGCLNTVLLTIATFGVIAWLVF